jgi:hypothetical protein
MSSISTTADRAADIAKNAAFAARDSLTELGSHIVRLANNLRECESGLLFANLGRHRETSRLPSVLWFAAGAAVVGGVALFLGSPGRKLRVRIGNLVHRSEDKSASREQAAEDNMANEGGPSRPRAEEHGREASH